MRRGGDRMAAPAIHMARNRIGSLIAVVLAALGGTAMITASLHLGESGLTARTAPERLAAADILIADPQRHPVPEDFDIALPERARIDPGLITLVAATPGVAAAVGDLSFPAALAGLDPATGQTADAGGHPWSIAALASPDIDGSPPTRPDELAVDADLAAASGIAPGDTITAVVLGDAADYTVSAVVDAPGTGLYFEDGAAADLVADPDGRIDLIAVTVDSEADAERVAEALRRQLAGHDLTVATGAARGDIEFPAIGAARGMLIAISGSLAGTILLLVGFVTAAAVSVSVANQRRDLALLRAVGATPKQVRRLVQTQAVAAAAVAVVPGVALGHLLTDRFATLLADSGLLPAAMPTAAPRFSGLIAAAVLLVTVGLAARIAAGRVSRMPATEAVAESRVEPSEPGRVRTSVGLVLLIAAAAQSLLPLFVRGDAAYAGAVGTILAVVGLALAGPALVRAVLGAAHRRFERRLSPPMWMALANSGAYSRRTAGAATVLALAVGLTITQVFMQTTDARVAADQRDAGLLADLVVTGGAVGGVSPARAAAAAAQPGVEHAVPVIATSAIRPGFEIAELVPLLAFEGSPAGVVDLDVTAGDLEDLTGAAVALSAAATGRGVDVGDTIDLILADGTPVRPTVVALYERGSGFGDIVASADLVTANGGARLFDAVLVRGATNEVERWAGSEPGLDTAPAAVLFGAEEGGDRWINLVVTAAMVGYVLLGVANNLVASTARRRTEFAALRVAGAVPRQVRAMMRREALVLSGLAVAAGLAISVVPMSVLGLGLAGRPWPQGPLWAIPAVAAVAVVIAVAAVMVPTRRALAEPPTAALAAVD